MTQEPMLQALNLMGNPEEVPEFISNILKRVVTILDSEDSAPEPGDEGYEAFEALGDDLLTYTRLLPFKIIEHFDIRFADMENLMHYMETINLVELFLNSYEFCVSGDIDTVEGELRDRILAIPKRVDTSLN